MSTSVFINISVQDLNAAKAFFEALGYSFNTQFTDNTAACLVISETIYVMHLTQDKMKQFTSKELVNAHQQTETIVALSAESKEYVDQVMEKALKAGGKAARPTEDYGFMYGRSFEDLDGHIWEIVWMDPTYVREN